MAALELERLVLMTPDDPNRISDGWIIYIIGNIMTNAAEEHDQASVVAGDGNKEIFQRWIEATQNDGCLG